VLQGIGGGALFPVGQSIAFGAFPPEKRASAAPVIGVPILLAPTLGPTIGGLLIDSWGWQYMFYINIPVGILTIFLIYAIIPADEKRTEKSQNRFDYVGLSLSMLGVLALVYALTLVSEIQPGTQTALNPRGDIYGWSYWLVWALIGAGAMLLLAFAFYELKVSKDPVVDLHLFKDYNFSVGAGVILFVTIVLFSGLLLIPVFLQQVRLPHYSAVDTGLALMPQGIGGFLGVVFGSRFYSKLGVRNLVIIGTILMAITAFPLMNFSPDTDGWALFPWLLLRGISFGVVAIPVQTLATQKITGPALAKANSLFNMLRQIAQSVGNAIVISLFVQQLVQHSNELRDQALRNIPAGVVPDFNNPAFAGIRDNLVSQAGTKSVNDVFMVLSYGLIALFLIALLLPGRKRQAEMFEKGSESHAMVVEM
jgi:EmrB/QacA subfamily drug resistance transporter